MQILAVTEVTDELIAAVERMVRQLDPAAVAPDRAHLEAVVSSPACSLLIAREEGSVPRTLGMLTLAWYPIPTGARAWIEDVVVDHSARGRGIGEALVRAGLERARDLGAAAVDLTSRPEREAANRLYRRMGFQIRDTNAYRRRLQVAED